MSNRIDISVVARDRATKQLRGMGRQIEGFARAASTAFIGIGAAVGGALGGIAGLVINAGNAASDLLTLASQTGMSVEQIQELQKVAELAGTDTGALARGIMTFTQNLEKASDPTSAVAEALNLMGINLTDVDGNMRSMGDIFPEVLKGLRDIEDPITRAQVAGKLFSQRLALELLPILELTDEEFEAFGVTARDVIGILSEDQLKALDESRQGWVILKGVMERAKNEIALELIPVFERMMDVFEERGIPVVNSLVETVERLVDRYMGLSDETKDLIDKAVLFALGLGVLGTVMAVLTPVVKVLIGFFKFLWKSVILKLALPALKLLGTALLAVKTFFAAKLIPALLTGAKVVLPLLGKAIMVVVGFFGWWLVLIAAVIAAGILLWKNWDEVKAKAVEIWGGITDWFQETIGKIKGWFTGLATDAADWGKNMMQGFLNGVRGMFGSVRDTITGFVNDMVDRVKDVLKISNPSAVFKEIGENMGKGMQLGLSHSMPAVAGVGSKALTFAPHISVNGGTNMGEADFRRMLNRYWAIASRESGF